MIDYIHKMCNEFPERLDGDTKYPRTEKLFSVDKKFASLKHRKFEFFPYTHNEGNVSS